jgi:hypothetical protein
MSKRKTTKKLIPAVFFQKRLNGVDATPKTPKRLELFESELRAVVGGYPPDWPGGDGSGGVTTYSGSVGWLDLLDADDCAAG